MCRINGIISPLLETKEIETIATQMRDVMQHGGPDDSGLLIEKSHHLALGSRRLALLDLSPAGHMPMQTPDGKYTIVFNGEVYNYLSIKEKLLQQGYRFQSKTDTEVVLWAYVAWKEKAFEMFNGMFAFTLLDLNEQCLYLVRDSAGIKPLYYYHKGKEFAFSSEVRAFAHLGRNLEEDPTWKFHFLTFGHIPEPYTTFKDVKMLKQGNFLKYNLQSNDFVIKPFFSYQFQNIITDREEAVAEIRKIFVQAVARHLLADEEVGIFLSGGIDSSLVALIGAEVADKSKTIHTLSVTFDEQEFSEENYQKIIKNELHQKLGNRTKSYDCKITSDDFYQAIPDLWKALDQPTTDGINTYFISQFARKHHVKAVLSGLGADELFGGYPSFRNLAKIDLLRNVPAFAYKSAKFLPNEKYKKLSFLSIPDSMGSYLVLRGIFVPYLVAQILDCDEAEVYQKLQPMTLNGQVKHLDSGNKASWLETNLYMKNQLLKDSDVMSMWHSIELRVPFLDKELMELAMRISPDIKFPQGKRAKDLLISAFEDILPNAIWNRQKQGFTFPFAKWLKNAQVLKNLEQNGQPFVKKMVKEYKQNQWHWTKIWALMVMEQWKIKKQ